MFLTKKHLSRRTVLKAAGVSIGLPLLDAMIPAATALAQTAAKPKLRAGFFYLPHGAIMWNTTHGAKMDHWMPSGAGASFKLSPILEPLESYKRYVTTFDRIEAKAPRGNVHAFMPATWLSGVHPDEEATGAKMAPTIDQLIAGHIGQDTVLPSLEVAAETTVQSASCGSGACYYSSTLAFRNATTPLPMEFNPRKVFYRLFGQGDTADERVAITSETTSILDAVAADAAALQKRLGPQDRVAMADYLDSVREIERRIQRIKSEGMGGVELPDAPVGIPAAFEEHLKLQFDMIALAYQANLTRVATFMMAREVSMRTYNNLSISDAFHPLSHHQENPAKIEKLVKVQNFHTKVFTGFLDRLAATKDGDGSLLDHSIILFGSNMSNSDKHNNDPLPAAIFGHAGGKIKGGQHLKYPQNTPHANLLLTLLNRAGVPVQKVGDSTGTFAEV